MGQNDLYATKIFSTKPTIPTDTSKPKKLIDDEFYIVKIFFGRYIEAQSWAKKKKKTFDFEGRKNPRNAVWT